MHSTDKCGHFPKQAADLYAFVAAWRRSSNTPGTPAELVARYQYVQTHTFSGSLVMSYSGTCDSLALSVAILGRVSTADILHRLCSPKLPLAQAGDTLYQTIELLENYSLPVPSHSTWTMFGIAVDVYRCEI